MVKMVETEVECCKIVSEDVKDAIVLEGSPELGLIGNILGWLLVEELKMKQIGYIDSKEFPPLAVLYKGIAIHPFRVYSTDGIVLFLSDFIIPPNVSYDMSNAIVDWMERNNSKGLITFNSMVVMEKTGSVAGAANSEEALKKLGELDLPILPFGNVNGLSGSLLTKTAIKNIPASCLFAEVLNQYPDPRAAASLVNVLNKMLNIDVNAQPLLKEADEIEERLKELAKRVQSENEPESPIYS
ncbi:MULTISPECIES: proteasome assembly chaperone family protein [Methanobacterium]|uniref:Proteasome assembly chaperone family protein n=1 Tax=Methanobacterium spitsbergense TaxID=2874285 RepID=A0A8T5USJ5_9EURY|nr:MULTISPECIES: proteasome assembly chaperone family protein [Methanobacterium]MBZ2164946.1 proteasome assembly chaperone family protein [Methanobacterium spitsbergense]